MSVGVSLINSPFWGAPLFGKAACSITTEGLKWAQLPIQLLEDPLAALAHGRAQQIQLESRS